ncbi:MAG: MBL fold metallo-hydrolase, partial [Clostridia bacterium]
MDHILFPSQQIGEFSITAISDGYLSASLDLLSNIGSMDASKLQQDAGVNDPSSIHINCYL